MNSQTLKFYQTGTFTVGNRLLGDDDRHVQATIDRNNSLNSGHRACRGCGEALGARYAVDAVMRVTKNKAVAVNATGCLEVFSTPYPESSWRLPWLHSLFGNAPAVAAGVAAASKVLKKNWTVIAQGGDGSTVDIGFGCLSGMFERNDDVLYICYDNEAYMNTGVQRSGSTPAMAVTSTTQGVGEVKGQPFVGGKNVPRIALAHGIPYVATASVADLHDLEAKVTKAVGIAGARYIHVHVPCPLGWGSDPALTIQLARSAVQCGLYPLFEGEYGRVIRTTKIRKRIPVTEYLEPQKRFAHLFGKTRDQNAIDRIQGIADENIRRLDLLDGEIDSVRNVLQV